MPDKEKAGDVSSLDENTDFLPKVPALWSLVSTISLFDDFLKRSLVSGPHEPKVSVAKGRNMYPLPIDAYFHLLRFFAAATAAPAVLEVDDTCEAASVPEVVLHTSGLPWLKGSKTYRRASGKDPTNNVV